MTCAFTNLDHIYFTKQLTKILNDFFNIFRSEWIFQFWTLRFNKRMRNMGNRLWQRPINPFVVLSFISISLALFVSEARGALVSQKSNGIHDSLRIYSQTFTRLITIFEHHRCYHWGGRRDTWLDDRFSFFTAIDRYNLKRLVNNWITSFLCLNVWDGWISLNRWIIFSMNSDFLIVVFKLDNLM